MSNMWGKGTGENVFDDKTRARLNRERLHTIQGLLTWIKRVKKREDAAELKQNEECERRKFEVGEEMSKTRTSKEMEVLTKSDDTRADYKLTKLSKSKAIRSKNEAQRREVLSQQHKQEKYFDCLFKLRTSLLHQQWRLTCHKEKRATIRENSRLKNIMRIMSEFEISNILPLDSIVFDKILKYKHEKRKQMKLRKERMIQIIEKISREMQPKRKKCFMKVSKENISLESSVKFSTEETLSNEQDLENLQTELEGKEGKEISKDKENTVEFNEIEKLKDVKGIKDINEEEKVSLDVNNFEEAMLITKIESSIMESYPKDNCFFSNPNLITFSDFKVGTKYSRKILITNKTSKWAYLRFNKVYTEVWEPGIIEIDIMDAARIKPGMHATINVKFSPVYDEKVTAEISFLTLNPDNTKTFHEFRIPVVCKPEIPEPVLDPTEIKFPAAPAWKFNDPKFSEKTLTVSNEGRKSFSVLIRERDDRKDCFLWHFDQAEVLSENENDENTENSIDTPRKTFQIEIPPKFDCPLKIIFRPRHIGLHHEVMKIQFFSDDRVFGTQEVPIWAEVIGPQIYLDPPCIDLGIAMIDADVCHQNFNVINNGRSSIQIFMKTPKILGNQVTVEPRSTILQPERFSTICVRLIPDSSILHLSGRYYDPISSMLEFPLLVQAVTREEEKPPHLSLKVLASLTTCRGLILEPADVDLGIIHTHESVYTELTLTNNSLLIQEYAFLFLPAFMEIQPNDGFGAILPGETIKLHLIYSARSTDIPGNEIGANGLAGERRFQVRVVTLAELASHKKSINISELRDLYDREKLNSRNRGLPPPIDLKSVEITWKTNDEDDKDPNNLADPAINDLSVVPKDLGLDVEETEVSRKLLQKERRMEKNVINVYVHIVDTFCEMNEQILEFPATPCGSFSMVSVYLRGYNMASYPHCTCGILKNQEKEFSARFKFKSSSDHVRMTPQHGALLSKQCVKVYFVFEPKLPRNDPNIEEPEKQEESKEKDKLKEKEGKKKKKKEKRGKTDKNEEISEIDKLPDEAALLEIFEPRISTIFVTCEIDLEMKDGTKKNELLFLKLVCPVTRPEIAILNRERDISFGPTAIGTSSRTILLVKNISNKSVKVDVSLLDPYGSFFAPSGKTIETGSVLSIPITYRPLYDHEEEEFFEVSSSRTRTRWRVKVSGRGVVPSYVLKPSFGVARIEVTDEKPVELKISIQNTGPCPLTFRFRERVTLEGNIPAAKDESPEKKKMKGKLDWKSEGKSPRRLEFYNDFRSEEQSAIFDGGLKKSMNPDCFSFCNLDENMQLLVPEGKKMEFGIRFQRPRDVEAKEKERSGEKPTKKKNNKKRIEESLKKEDEDKLNYCYVILVELTLGGSVHVQDLTIICSLK